MQVIIGHPFSSIELHGISPSGQVFGQEAGHHVLLAAITLGMQVLGPMQPLASSWNVVKDGIINLTWIGDRQSRVYGWKTNQTI